MLARPLHVVAFRVVEYVSISVAALALVTSLVASGYTWLARPSALRREVNLLSDGVAELERQVIKQETRGVEVLKNVESIHDAVLADLERAESKRRSAAAKESRNRGNQQPIDYNDPATLRDLARRSGFEL